MAGLPTSTSIARSTPARLAGVNINLYKLGVYTLAGLMAGFAAIILTSRTKSGQPVSGFGGHAYDGLMIFAEAAKRAGSFDKAKVRDEIEKTKNFIGTGGVVNMSPTDHLGLDLSAFRMLEIKGGDWTLVQ